MTDCWMTRARAMIARARLLRLFHVLLSVLSSRANDDVRLRGQGLPTYEHGQPPPKVSWVALLEPLTGVRFAPAVTPSFWQAGHVRFDVVFQANSSLAYNHMAMIEWLPARSRIVAAWQAARLSEGSKSQVCALGKKYLWMCFKS